jgi:hypothetical protein
MGTPYGTEVAEAQHACPALRPAAPVPKPYSPCQTDALDDRRNTDTASHAGGNVAKLSLANPPYVCDKSLDGLEGCGG